MVFPSEAKAKAFAQGSDLYTDGMEPDLTEATTGKAGKAQQKVYMTVKKKIFFSS